MAASTTGAKRWQGIVIALLIVGGLAALLILAMPYSIQAQADHQRCKFRLRRLGIAVNLWVADHGRAAFPPIRNPAAGAAWRPDRPDSADTVLWEYLQGDIPRPRREDESEAAYLARLRGNALTVCPFTKLPFWYNEGLKRLKPGAVAEGAVDPQWYFRCQRFPDGRWPVVVDGQEGVYAVRGESVHVTVSPDEVKELRQRIALEAAQDPQTPGLQELRGKLAQYERAMDQARAQDPQSDGTFTMSTLVEDVYFEAKAEP